MTPLFILALWSIAALIYMVPTIVAFRWNHPNRWLILALNLALGGTVFGWVICIVWASRAVHLTDDPEGSNGGESGLNLFVNDVQRVRIEAGDAQPAPQVPPNSVQELFARDAARSAADQDTLTRLERLAALFDRKVIDQAQFERMKARVLSGEQ